MKQWDYAEMSKEAKKHGGPKKYLEEYGMEKYNEGKLVGEDIGERKGVIEGTAATFAFTGLCMLYFKVRDKLEERRIRKIAEAQARAESAKNMVLNGMNEYHCVQPDIIDSNNEHKKEDCKYE